MSMKADSRAPRRLPDGAVLVDSFQKFEIGEKEEGEEEKKREKRRKRGKRRKKKERKTKANVNKIMGTHREQIELKAYGDFVSLRWD